MTGLRADSRRPACKEETTPVLRPTPTSRGVASRARRAPGNYYINRQRAVRERKDVNETTLVTSARFILGITRKTLTKRYYGIAGHRESRYVAELKVISGIITRVLLRVEIWHAVHCQTRKQNGEESTRALISVK